MASGALEIADRKLPQIYLCSSIGEEYLEELEEMFFFNPRQHIVRERVAQHVERYGAPEILHHDETITMGLARIDHAQTLFLMGGDGRANLIGVGLFVREEEHLKILYFALRPDFTSVLLTALELMLFMLDSLKNIGRGIKGVKYVDWSVGRKEISFAL